MTEKKQTSIFKWIVIGILGCFSLLMITILLLVWKFTPIIKVDQQSGKVELFGGLIDLDQTHSTFSYSSSTHIPQNTLRIEGEEELINQGITTTNISFSNGKLDIETSKDAEFEYDCKIQNGSPQITHKIQNSILTLDLTSAKGVDCEIEVPEEVNIQVQGQNGEITIDPIDNTYQYDLKVQNGKVENPQTSNNPKGPTFKATLANGQIKVLE